MYNNVLYADFQRRKDAGEFDHVAEEDAEWEAECLRMEREHLESLNQEEK